MNLTIGSRLGAAFAVFSPLQSDLVKPGSGAQLAELECKLLHLLTRDLAQFF